MSAGEQQTRHEASFRLRGRVGMTAGHDGSVTPLVNAAIMSPGYFLLVFVQKRFGEPDDLVRF